MFVWIFMKDKYATHSVILPRAGSELSGIKTQGCRTYDKAAVKT